MKLLLTTTLFFLSICAFAQEAWTDHSATARNKAYVGVESHSWTLFRHDFTDRTVGVFFYF